VVIIEYPSLPQISLPLLRKNILGRGKNPPEPMIFLLNFIENITGKLFYLTNFVVYCIMLSLVEKYGDYVDTKKKNIHQGDFIKFLGTAGARFVVSRQLRASGGLWFSLGGEAILVDPGPGSLLKCFSSRPKLDPSTLNGIILTHRHLDHSNDVNVIIESMTNGGRNKKGFLYAPGDALNAPDPVVQFYVREFLDEIGYLKEGKIIDRVTFSVVTPVRHQHPVETYGVKFYLPYGCISLISDTAFFPELIDYYGDADLLIINVVIFQDYVNENIFHLTFNQAKRIIDGIKPKTAILTHFGMTMLQQKPYLLARNLEDERGVKVVAAADGLKFELANLFFS
jgi:phosphoribosyl 1,2-cyclic phosphodiesterase